MGVFARILPVGLMRSLIDGGDGVAGENMFAVAAVVVRLLMKILAKPDAVVARHGGRTVCHLWNRDIFTSESSRDDDNGQAKVTHR